MIILQTENFTKKIGTKNVWQKTENTENSVMSKIEYYNIIDAKRFFKKIGAKENHIKNYTKIGFVVVQINSISPCKLYKTVRKFEFK
jgi:hypothetical protein